MGYDLFALAVLGITTYRGATKGIAWQLAAIAALVLCFLFATPLSLAVAPSISLAPPLNRWVAMLAIYLVFSFGTFAIARGFREMLEKAKFQEYDRHLGAVFGFIKGATICLVLTFFVVALSESNRDYILKTYSGYAAAHVMDGLHPVMPAELHAVLEPYIHQLDTPELRQRHGHEQGDHEHSDEDIAQDGDRPRSGYHPTDPGRDGDPFAADEPRHQGSATGGTEVATDNPSTLEGLIRGIPALADRALRNLAMQALQNTEPEHRPELVDRLQSGLPEVIEDAAKDWRNGKPANADRDLAQERMRLTEEITLTYSDRQAARDILAEEIDQALAGLPAGVTLGVLTDWHADLLARDPDPDSETDVSTPLDVRITRQLRRAGVPRSRLSAEWRDRLDEVERR